MPITNNTINLHPIDLDCAMQINDGLTQTSGDGVVLAFDTKYGIMFCTYMPGRHGSYGESRGKIALSYFPASRPTNIKYVTITEGRTEYVPNIISLGDGKTWSEPIAIKDSIGCRPRMIVHNGHILMAYNVYNTDTGNRHIIPGGRCELKLTLGEAEDPNDNTCVVDVQSKYGIVNIALVDIMGDAYMAFSTSECALEYHNGNSKVRGKDAIRYIKLGDLSTNE